MKKFTAVLATAAIALGGLAFAVAPASATEAPSQGCVANGGTWVVTQEFVPEQPEVTKQVIDTPEVAEVTEERELTPEVAEVTKEVVDVAEVAEVSHVEYEWVSWKLDYRWSAEKPGHWWGKTGETRTVIDVEYAPATYKTVVVTPFEAATYETVVVTPFEAATYKTVVVTPFKAAIPEEGYCDTNETLNVEWLMPYVGDTEPSVDDPSIWNQTLYTEDVCGTAWIQNDVWKYGTPAEKELADSIIAGGVLELINGTPADASLYISHTFTQQEPCPVVVEEPEEPEEPVVTTSVSETKVLAFTGDGGPNWTLIWGAIASIVIGLGGVVVPRLARK